MSQKREREPDGEYAEDEGGEALQQGG